MQQTEIIALLKESQPLAERFGPNGPGLRKIHLSQSEQTQPERFPLLGLGVGVGRV